MNGVKKCFESHPRKETCYPGNLNNRQEGEKGMLNMNTIFIRDFGLHPPSFKMNYLNI